MNKPLSKMIKNNETQAKSGNISPEWDLQKVKIDSQGVHDFFWPMAYGKVSEFNNKSMDLYSVIIKAFEEAGSEDDLIPYKVFGKYYLCEISGIYRSLLLQKECLKAEKSPKLPDNWILTQFTWQGRPPIHNVYLDTFKNKPSQKKKLSFLKLFFKRGITFFKNFRPHKNGMTFGGLKLSAITEDKLKNSIIVTQRTELILKHAKIIEKEKIFCRSNRWFSFITEEEIQKNIQHKNVELEKEILNIFLSLCKKSNIKVSNEIRAYIVNFIEEGIACLRIHNDRLKRPSSVMLPKHIWTGTAGNVWDLLLRLNVSQSGGTVEAHDHGIASGLTGTYSIPFLELWGCDKFYTYTDAHAGLLKKLANNSPTLSKKNPDILGLSKSVNKNISQKTRTSKKVKTIMIVSTIYDRDRGRLTEIGAEIARVDFQARLISYLKRQGYNVIFKGHPESPSKPPEAFTMLGAKIEERPFNKVQKDADLFLFDYACTSTFKEALETDLPFVIIDLEKVEWESEMLPLFKNRAEIVHSEQDKNNRFTINWECLDKAINQSISKANNRLFYETYFGFSD